MSGRPRVRRLALAIVVLAAGTVATRLAGQAGSSIELVSTATDGSPAGGPDFVGPEFVSRGAAKVSADNRYVVFVSASGRIVAGDTNLSQNVFVRDRLTATTRLVSRSPSGVPGNGHSGAPVISANGRFVAFVSAASNLVAGDSNSAPDVFLHDLQSGSTTRVSVSSTGAESATGAAQPAISADGRFVAFQSYSSNLVPGDTNVFNSDVFVRDTALATTTRVSVRADGSEIVRASSTSPSISADGTRVAFFVVDDARGGPPPATDGPNLHKGYYVRDLAAGSTTLVNARPDGTASERPVGDPPAISADGRSVAFADYEDLDPDLPDASLEGDGPLPDVFVRDLETGTTSRVSLPFTGGPVEESGSGPTISREGRYVAYQTDTGIRIRDRVAGATGVVLTPAGSQPDAVTHSGSLSENGLVAVFQSFATNLVLGDTNGQNDTFLFSAGPSADLSLTLDASPLQPGLGADVALTVRVSNAGPNAAGTVTVALPIPAGLAYVSDGGGVTYNPTTGVWTIGALAANASSTLVINTRLTAVTSVGVLAQVATASLPDPDSMPGNDNPLEDDQRTVTIVPTIADLSLSLSANTLTPALNSNVLLTAQITNSGPAAANGVVVRLPMPAGLQLVSATPATQYVSATGAWTLPVIPAGGSLPLRLVARVTGIGAIDVSAEVIAAAETDADSTPANGNPAEDDYATVRLTPANLGIVVNDDGTVVSANDGRCTLVEAIVAANTDVPSGNAIGECAGGSGADIIHLRALSGTYLVSAVHNTTGGPNGLPVIASDITIDGGGAVISRSSAVGVSPFRVFYVDVAGRLALDRVTVQNGLATTVAGGGVFGGGIFSLGRLELTASAVSGNRATCDGGGIYAAGPLVVANGSRIDGNVSGCTGGGVTAGIGSTTIISDSAIVSNSATTFGGGANIGGTVANIVTSRIEGNTAGGSGGGLYHDGAGTLGITGSVISLNRASAGPGGGVASGRLDSAGSIVGLAPGLVAVSGSTVSSNEANGFGGGLASAGPLTVETSTFISNRSASTTSCGGGLFAAGPTQVTATTLALNDGGNGGGGLCAVRTPTLIVTGGSVANNAAGNGGGLAMQFDVAADAHTVTLSGVVIERNQAQAGGGLSLTAGPLDTIDIAGTTVRLNTATGGGGGISAAANGTTLSVRDNTQILSNVATGPGGGIAITNVISFARLGIRDSLIDGNRSLDTLRGGGGLAVVGSALPQVSLLRSIVRGNSAPNGQGGGIWSGGALSVGASLLEGNAAGLRGGGLVAVVGSSLDVDDSIIRNNTAPQGGGLMAEASSTFVRTTTIAGNRADIGAGISTNSLAQQLWLLNSTISGNTATAAGAGALQANGAALGGGALGPVLEIHGSTIADNRGTPGGLGTRLTRLTVAGTIVAGNRLPNDRPSECADLSGTQATAAFNVIGRDAGCFLATNATTVDAAAVFTALLGPLADNGGPTPTHAPLPGSIAIDAGDLSSPGALSSCLPFDQRGLPRPANGSGLVRCDIGSVEQQSLLAAPAAVLSALTPTTLAAGAAGATIDVVGRGFHAFAEGRWNGQPRSTQVVGPDRLQIRVPASDLVAVTDLSTVVVSVGNPDGSLSNDLPVVVVGPAVRAAASAIAAAGQSSSASLPATAAGNSGLAGTITNGNAGSAVATLTLATYATQPTGTVIQAAGGFYDVQITGADASDSATVRFYYPSTVTGSAEAALQLTFWNGNAWTPVLTSGGGAPLQDTTDNLDGSVSGGRVTVVFDATSTPDIRALGGTVFALRETSLPAGLQFSGFLRPIVNPPAVNRADDGDRVPIRWRLADASGRPVSSLEAVVSLTTQRVACGTWMPLPGTSASTAAGEVRYDPRLQTYVFLWKTERRWDGCRRLTLSLSDGSAHTARFRFR